MGLQFFDPYPHVIFTAVVKTCYVLANYSCDHLNWLYDNLFCQNYSDSDECVQEIWIEDDESTTDHDDNDNDDNFGLPLHKYLIQILGTF